jgi:hypothetical protein
MDERMVLEIAVENELWRYELGQIQCLDFILAAFKLPWSQ